MKRGRLGVFAGVFFTLIHFLLEGLGLFFIRKGQSCQTILKLKCMEECPILVVRERIVDFLIPDDATIRRLGDNELLEFQLPLIFMVALTDTSTSLIQNVFPIRSFARTAAPWRPV